MKELIVLGSDKELSLRQGNILVKNQEGTIEDILALNRIESISVFGNPQITTQLIKAIAKKQVNLHYFSTAGVYLSSLMSAQQFNYEDQQSQFIASCHSDFCLDLSKRFILSKISNQRELLMAFDNDGLFNENDLKKFDKYCAAIKETESLQSLRGYEGKAATLYFYYLRWILPHEFHFSKRTKHPPKDAFSSLLSLGYSLVYSYIIGQIYKYGLNPGIGLMHQNKRKHACLASDLMEEWRPVLVDDTVLHLIFDKEIDIRDFIFQEDGTVYLAKEKRKIYINRFNNRLFENHCFFNNRKLSAKYSINQQIESLKRSFVNQDPSLYQVLSVGGNYE